MKIWVTIAIRAYFRRIKVIGLEKIPENTPVIFAPNHQYAFMDALVIGTINKKIPYFLVRGDIFKSSLASFVLRSLRMMPVYRKRDKVDVVAKNEEIFNQCVEKLIDGNHLTIFPEGNHSKIRRIRPMRKGIMRIAFRAFNEDPNHKNLVIIPIGINYDDQSKFQSDLFVNIGDPIRIADYNDQYLESQPRVFTEIGDKMYNQLIDLAINIDNAESYKFYENVLKIYTPHFMRNMGMRYRDLVSRFDAYRQIIEGMDRIRELGRDQFKKFEAANNRFFKQRLKSSFDPVYLGTYFTSRLQKFKNYVGLIIFLPIYLYGLLNNLLALALPYFISMITVRDDHWISSVKLAIGLVSFPLTYTIQAIIFSSFFPNKWYVVLYILSVILTGILAKIYQNWIHKFWEGFKIFILKSTDRKKYVRIKRNYSDLIEKLDEILLARNG